MARGWIEIDPNGGARNALSASGRKAARPYAVCANDIYPDQFGRAREDAAPVLTWTELLHSNTDRVLGVNFAALHIFMGRLFGFNARLYKLPFGAQSTWALAYEGSAIPANITPREITRAIQDWLLTNAPANALDAFNLLEPIAPLGLFSRFLNPRHAPTTQYDVAHLVAEAAIRKFGLSNLVLTGHSLGGGLASYAAARTGARAVVFNSAGVGVRCALEVDMESLKTTVCHLATTNDPALKAVLGGTAMKIGAVGQAALGVAGLNPLAVTSAPDVYRAGAAMSASSPYGAGDLFGQIANKIVTSYTDFSSKHPGTLYVLGVGGHDMQDVLRFLPCA